MEFGRVANSSHFSIGVEVLAWVAEAQCFHRCEVIVAPPPVSLTPFSAVINSARMVANGRSHPMGTFDRARIGIPSKHVRTGFP